MSSKNQENEVSPIYSWPPSDSGKYLGGNGPSMSSSFQQVQFSQIGGSITPAQLPTGTANYYFRGNGVGVPSTYEQPQFSQVGGTVALSQFTKGSAGTVLVGNGASDSSYKYWLPSLGLGTNTGSAAPSALLVDGDKQTTPTVKGIHVGMDAGNNAAIEITSSTSTNASYIDFTYPGSDARGRIIYQHNTNTFLIVNYNGTLELQSGATCQFRINPFGALLLGGAGNAGASGQFLMSNGTLASPSWLNYLPFLGIGSAATTAALGLVVDANKQTTPTVKGVHIGMDSGTTAGIELTASSAAASSYIDFTYVNTDARGRLIYNHATDVFEMSSPQNIRFSTNGVSALNINYQGAFGVGPTPGYGTNGQVLTSQGISASPIWQSYSALLTRPVQTIYDGPAINAPFPLTNLYSFTLPAGYLYAVIDLQAGGGRGGSIENSNFLGTLNLWGGGGAGGGRVTVRVKSFDYPAGTIIDFGVGSGASTANFAGGGYDTYMAIGVNYTLAKGGSNGAGFISTVNNVGNGGTCSTNIFAGLIHDIILDHWGQNGKYAFSADSVNFAVSGFSGEGGSSLQGQPGPMVSVFGTTVRNGTNANGRGAGGEGAVGANIPAGQFQTGGSGSPGWASITVFYQ